MSKRNIFRGPWGEQYVPQPRPTNAAVVAVLEPPASEVLPVEGEMIFEDYKKLVAELGVNDAPIRNEEMRRFLNESGITAYPYEKVVAFMDAKVEQEKKAHGLPGLDWEWVPVAAGGTRLRKDLGPLPSFVIQSGIVATWTIGGREMSSELNRPDADVYDKAIPYPALLTMKTIKDRFGDSVQFYVSDYAVRRPDPFLLVTGPGLDRYVIERWNEPGFRG